MKTKRIWSEEDLIKLKQLYLEENQSQANIGKIFGISQTCVGDLLRKNNIPLRKYKEFYDACGEKFYSLTVIKFVGRRNSNGNSLWLCKCDCGRESISDLSTMKSGKAKSCGMCSWIGEITQDFWHGVERNAERRGYEFTITKDYAWKLYEEQNRKCALTGIEIYFGTRKYNIDKSKNKTKRTTTCSIDRKDNSKGYITGNIQWVHKDVNIMRRNYTIERFIEICRCVVEYNKGNNE